MTPTRVSRLLVTVHAPSVDTRRVPVFAEIADRHTRASGSPATARPQDHLCIVATFHEPDADPAACRWAALRNQAHGLDVVATVIRHDGCWARLHNNAHFARSVCANFAQDEPG